MRAFVRRGLALPALAGMLVGGGAAHADALCDLPVGLAALALRQADPSCAAMEYASGLERAFTCFARDMTPEQWEEALTMGLLPPAMLVQPDFWTDTTVWTGESQQGPSARAAKTSLTYSFPDDGVTWGISSISATRPNELAAQLTAEFGANDLDEGREYIRQALASWRKYTSLTYVEVADLNVPMNQTITSPGNGGGDVRIGSGNTSPGGFLAYNAFPNSAFAGVGGSDMYIDAADFISTRFNDSADNYRYFRNTVAHEHGHGLGAIHAIPCNDTKLMEPSISTDFDVVQMDDRRGGGRNYGDRYAGNHSAGTAKDFGDLTTPSARSVRELDLSLNGTAGFGNTDEDWFAFTLDSTQNVFISATPTGGTYSAGQQSFSCSGTQGSINAASAGNINIEVRDASGAAVLFSATSAAAGSVESISQSLPAGSYTLRVFDVGPNASANQTVQVYDLLIRVAGEASPPQAIAGIDKRIGANTNCFFIGDINSRVTQVGATLSSYMWDLNGDGVFETAGMKANRQYVSNGVYPVTLRVTDSNGKVGEDTINVTVFGATTTLTNVAPANGMQGETVSVTLTGTNLKNLTSASMVSVSGAGVTVVGTPAPNAEGTSVAGLSLQVDPGAATGGRNITVTNPDGTATLTLAFAVMPGFTPCPGDTNGDRIVNFADLNVILSQFGQTGAGLTGDLNNDGVVNFTDLNIVLSNFGVVCP